MKPDYAVAVELRTLVSNYRMGETTPEEFIELVTKLSDDDHAEFYAWVTKRVAEREAKEVEFEIRRWSKELEKRLSPADQMQAMAMLDHHVERKARNEGRR